MTTNGNLADELEACDGWGKDIGGYPEGYRENYVVPGELRERILAALRTTPAPDVVDDIRDLIETAISDSLDIDWTSSVAADSVIRALTKEGWAIYPPEPFDLRKSPQYHPGDLA